MTSFSKKPEHNIDFSKLIEIGKRLFNKPIEKTAAQLPVWKLSSDKESTVSQVEVGQPRNEASVTPKLLASAFNLMSKSIDKLSLDTPQIRYLKVSLASNDKETNTISYMISFYDKAGTPRSIYADLSVKGDQAQGPKTFCDNTKTEFPFSKEGIASFVGDVGHGGIGEKNDTIPTAMPSLAHNSTVYITRAATMVRTAFVEKTPNKEEWCVKSEKGKNLGCKPSKGGAEKRLREVEYFKHEGIQDDEIIRLGTEGTIVYKKPGKWNWCVMGRDGKDYGCYGSKTRADAMAHNLRTTLAKEAMGPGKFTDTLEKGDRVKIDDGMNQIEYGTIDRIDYGSSFYVRVDDTGTEQGLYVDFPRSVLTKISSLRTAVEGQGGLESELPKDQSLSINEEGSHLDTKCPALGGKGANVPDDQFDPKELEMGLEVEHEHTGDPEVAKAIAKDHLIENKNYYSHLKDMEKNFGKPKEDEMGKEKTSPAVEGLQMAASYRHDRGGIRTDLLRLINKYGEISLGDLIKAYKDEFEVEEEKKVLEGMVREVISHLVAASMVTWCPVEEVLQSLVMDTRIKAFAAGEGPTPNEIAMKMTGKPLDALDPTLQKLFIEIAEGKIPDQSQPLAPSGVNIHQLNPAELDKNIKPEGSVEPGKDIKPASNRYPDTIRVAETEIVPEGAKPEAKSPEGEAPLPEATKTPETGKLPLTQVKDTINSLIDMDASFKEMQGDPHSTIEDIRTRFLNIVDKAHEAQTLGDEKYEEIKQKSFAAQEKKHLMSYIWWLYLKGERQGVIPMGKGKKENASFNGDIIVREAACPCKDPKYKGPAKHLYNKNSTPSSVSNYGPESRIGYELNGANESTPESQASTRIPMTKEQALSNEQILKEIRKYEEKKIKASLSSTDLVELDILKTQARAKGIMPMSKTAQKVTECVDCSYYKPMGEEGNLKNMCGLWLVPVEEISRELGTCIPKSIKIQSRPDSGTNQWGIN